MIFDPEEENKTVPSIENGKQEDEPLELRASVAESSEIDGNKEPKTVQSVAQQTVAVIQDGENNQPDQSISDTIGPKEETKTVPSMENGKLEDELLKLRASVAETSEIDGNKEPNPVQSVAQQTVTVIQDAENKHPDQSISDTMDVKNSNSLYGTEKEQMLMNEDTNVFQNNESNEFGEQPSKSFWII